METIKRQITQVSVEITKEQFNDLIGDMVPTGPAEIAQIAKEMILVSGTSPEIIDSIERCRRFLNTQRMIREMMLVFAIEKNEINDKKRNY